MLAYSEWQNINQIRGDVFHALHLDPTESRYQVGYLDLDDEIVDIALGVAQRSDRAKALSKKIEWHNRTQSRNGWEELQEQIRQYQKERDEAESALELKADEIKASRAART